MAQKGIQTNPVEFFVILNSLYSDYCSLLKKYNVNKMDIYVDLASAWLKGSGTVPDKATAAFTLDVYGHVSEKMKDDSAARMEAYIAGVSGSSNGV